MRAFVKKIAVFILLVVGLVFSLDLFVSDALRKKANFNLPSNPKYIMLGHSHPQCAYNDSIIPNFKNLAESGESYLYTYVKTKQILQQNPQLKIVFLEYSNNQLDPEMDDWTWDHEHISTMYTKYASFFTLKDKGLLLRHNPSGYLNSLSVANLKSLERLSLKDVDFTSALGDYLPLNKSKADSFIKVIQSSKGPSPFPKPNKISEVNVKYLSKIIDLCKKMGKRVILVRSPLHPSYQLSNEKLYQEILKNTLPDVEYLDCSKFPLGNKEFADLEHLNTKGAAKYSLWFAEMMEQTGLEKSKMKEYVQTNLDQQSIED